MERQINLVKVICNYFACAVFVSAPELINGYMHLLDSLGRYEGDIVGEALATDEKFEPLILQGCLTLRLRCRITHCVNHHLLLLRSLLPTSTIIQKQI